GRSTKGLPVMSLVKNIENDNWTKNYTYYDTKARAIGTHSINHLGGYTQTESKLDFAGVAQNVVTRHKRLATDTETVIIENFEYDHQNRLLVHKHQVNSNPVEILTQNTYNELSQLESKKVGGISVGTPLQQIDYKYNIRGWMTKINDPANLNGKLFGYEIKY
ncbi:RHS repeat-associated core domain-containing protein, partial [Chryseobacterium pennae]